MSFELSHFHIDSSSPEGQIIEEIMRRDHVSPEEAVRRAIRTSSALDASVKKPGELLFGLFSDDPDLMQRISDQARQARDREQVQNYDA